MENQNKSLMVAARNETGRGEGLRGGGGGLESEVSTVGALFAFPTSTGSGAGGNRSVNNSNLLLDAATAAAASLNMATKYSSLSVTTAGGGMGGGGTNLFPNGNQPQGMRSRKSSFTVTKTRSFQNGAGMSPPLPVVVMTGLHSTTSIGRAGIELASTGLIPQPITGSGNSQSSLGYSFRPIAAASSIASLVTGLPGTPGIGVSSSSFQALASSSVLLDSTSSLGKAVNKDKVSGKSSINSSSTMAGSNNDPSSSSSKTSTSRSIASSSLASPKQVLSPPSTSSTNTSKTGGKQRKRGASNISSIFPSVPSTPSSTTNDSTRIMTPQVPLDVLQQQKEKERDEKNLFEKIVREVHECLADFEKNVDDLVRLDESDANVDAAGGMTIKIKLTRSLLASKLYRSKSKLHQPIFTLLKQISISSSISQLQNTHPNSWTANRSAMNELEKDYHRHHFVMEVAIRKLEGAEERLRVGEAQRYALGLWEKFAKRILHHLQEQGRSGDPSSSSHPHLLSLDQIKQAQEDQAALAQKHQLMADIQEETERLVLKRQILDSVVEEPAWRIVARQGLNSFIEILGAVHPGCWPILGGKEWRQREGGRFMNPFPYLSTRSGTCRVKRSNGTELRRTKSLPNISEIYKQEEDFREYLDWRYGKNSATEIEGEEDEEEGWEDDEEGLISASSAISNENGSNPLKFRVRANSANAFWDILEVQPLPQPNLDEDSIMDTLSNEMDVATPVVDDFIIHREDGTLDFSIPSQEFFLSLLGPESNQRLSELLATQKTTDLATSKEILKNRDENLDKDIFTLQEIMELTLLHAHQLHLIKQDYDGHEEQQRINIEGVISAKNREIEQLKSNLQKLSNGNDADSHEQQISEDLIYTGAGEETHQSRIFQVQAESASSKRSTKSSLKSNANLAANVKSIVGAVVGPAATRPVQNPNDKQANQALKKKLIVKAPTSNFRQRNEQKSNVTPTFKSALFKMTFFERLKFFEAMSVKYHDSHNFATKKAEREVNARKLAYLSLMEEEESEKVRQELPTETMPMPEDLTAPPSLKTRGAFIFSDFSPLPWGGKFQIPETNPKNTIINLIEENRLATAKKSSKISNQKEIVEEQGERFPSSDEDEEEKLDA